MVIVMDNETGASIESEFGPFEDEVLGANWLPCPEVSLGLAEAVPARPARSTADFDADAFLRNVYLSQE